jgi:hypothetical protein
MEPLDETLAGAGAVLAPDRILRRLIKRHRKVGGIGLQVPHATCYSLPRADLDKLVAKGELGADLAKLPERVVVFHGVREDLAAGKPEAFSRAWRAIFHARIHEAFEAKLASKELTAASIRERINRIGQTEFDEIRFVLRQEDLLLPPGDDAETYVEFVAVYLELQMFAPRSIQRTFPTLHDTAHVDATIELDLDAAKILAAARPPGAPEQPIVEETAPHTPEDPPARVTADPSAKPRAEAARAKGNHARAAILSARAGDLGAARADLDALANRLGAALGTEGHGWSEVLLPVATFAASQRVLRFTPGARLLHDLQKACVVAEREVKVVDLVTWATSLGKRPIVRALPASREVRIAKALKAAAEKVAECGLPGADDRERLAETLHHMIERAAHNVREQLRPKIEATLDEVKLRPRHLPERVAQKKIVDELLDHAVDVGRLTIGNLRDALSHNDLKMPDLTLKTFFGRDQLLAADRLLAVSLDGVYLRGPIYLRFLQRLSSVLFGTVPGRLLTLFLLLPALLSVGVLMGVEHTIGLVFKLITHHEMGLATKLNMGIGAVVMFLLIHAPPFRRAVWTGLRWLGVGLRTVLVDGPLFVWRQPFVQRFRNGAIASLIVKPAIPAAIVAIALHGKLRWPIAGATFVALSALINSRPGQLVEEIAADSIVRSGHHVWRRLLPGLFKYIVDFFAELMELLDRGIYHVDEWLRFKSGQSKATLVAKGVLGTGWFFVTYLVRIIINLFLEPMFNPVKHFPTVTVAAKATSIYNISWTRAVAHQLRPFLHRLAYPIGGFFVFILPGLAGFLVWELKENWRVYRATRPNTLKAVQIGHHGETMVAFMKPGFHSGTIPKIYAKLRRAAWKSDEKGVARHKEALHHVEEAIEKFADRELVSMLNESNAFHATDVNAQHVEIASNRVAIELVCPSIAAEPAQIVFEEQSGWLLAGMPEAGWLDRLSDEQRGIFEIALAGFYKLAGVDVVREQVEDTLRDAGGAVPAYDIADEGLVVWPGKGYKTEVVYDLRATALNARVRGEAWDGELATVAGRSALYGREPLSWSSWATAWEKLAAGERPARIAVGPSLLPAKNAPSTGVAVV